MIDELLAARPTAKRLILSLLSAPGMESVEVGLFVRWGSLFDIDPAATRVAVGRLAKQGLITAVERGVYSIGPSGSLMAQTASQWVGVEDQIQPWLGGWIAVHTAHLGRTNKTALRARERALRLNGFAELVPGLWCRPDNFAQELELTRQGLIALGLESTAVVMQVSALPGTSAEELYTLWPRKQLEAGYRQHIAAMAGSVKRLNSLGAAEAARETFLIGEAVIRCINADPLLPSQMVDSRARQELIARMVDYNEHGRRAWAEFRGSFDSPRRSGA